MEQEKKIGERPGDIQFAAKDMKSGKMHYFIAQDKADIVRMMKELSEPKNKNKTNGGHGVVET